MCCGSYCIPNEEVLLCDDCEPVPRCCECGELICEPHYDENGNCYCESCYDDLFTEEQLKDNIKAFVSVILKSKPSVVKGVYVKNVSLSTTMGPGIKLDVNSFDK